MNSEGRIRLEFGKQLQADHGRGANRQIGLEFFMRRNERAAVSISHQNGDEKQTAPPAQTQTPRGPNAALEAISVATKLLNGSRVGQVGPVDPCGQVKDLDPSNPS